MSNRKNRIVKNYSLNMLYEIFLLIIPIFVTPYIARIIGEDGSGQYSYTLSINSYFTLFAALGFNYYAQRLIASHQGDRQQQSIDFWEIVFIRLISCSITILLYITTIALGIYGKKYNELMIILTINIVAVIFDINFYFQGNEEFDKIVIRSIIIKSISIICIFCFINKSSDLWKYVLIQSLTLLVSNIAIWVYMPKYLDILPLKELHPMKHLKPTLILFIPTIALSVYTALDKTLIGVITKTDSENGNYEYAEKLIKMFLTILTSLGTVLSPRNSKMFAEGNIESLHRNIYHTCRFVFLLGIPLMLGIIVVSDNLIPWYLGEGYGKAATLMKLLAPLIIIIGLSNVFGRQYLIPCKQDNKFTIAIICGAGTNLCLNIILIRAFASYGAAIATVIAESVVTFVMLAFMKKSIHFKTIVLDSWKYWPSGVIMFLICLMIQKTLTPSVLHTIFIAIIGVFIYGACIILIKDEFALSLAKRIIKRKH